MTSTGSPSRSAWCTFRYLLRVGAAPRKQVLLAAGLAVGGALTTVALMACSGALIDKAALRPPLYTLTVLMAAVQLLALARGPLRYGERLVSHDTTLRALGRLRLWLYDEIEPRSPAGLRLWHSGDVLARATGDVDALEDLYLRGILPLLTAAAVSVVAVMAVTVILPEAGLVLGGGLIGALGVTSGLSWVRQRRFGTQEASLRGALTADVVELLEGAGDLLAFGREQEYLGRVLAADDALTRLARRRSWTAGAVSAMTVLCTGLVVVGLVAVAVPAVSRHRLPGFMLAVLPLVAMSALEVVRPVADAVATLSHQMAAARRLLAVADLPIPVTDPVPTRPSPVDADVGLRDATLRYRPDQPPALDGLSLSVPEGGRVALVGASGAGKSSVVNVLLRFWGLSSGDVTLGGVPMGDLAQDEVRHAIGWVAQDTHLFNATIRANVAVARPDADDEAVMDALRAAQLGDFVEALPEGFHTEIGEGGRRLSGGQRQRLALARALLARPPVLVLDEPTAGLDQPTAARLLRDLLDSADGASLVYITHRLDEVAAFDEVNVIERGRVVARSDPQHRPTPDLECVIP